MEHIGTNKVNFNVCLCHNSSTQTRR